MIIDFFKFDLNMASLNKDSSQKDIFDDSQFSERYLR